MSIQQNADGSYSVYDAGGNVVISSTDAESAAAYDAQYGNTGTPATPSGGPGQGVVGGPHPPVSGSQPGIYQTVNGPRTVAQMRAELAHSDPTWNSKSDYEVQQEYQRVTTGVAGGGGAAGAGGDVGFSQGAANAAIAAAQQAYLNARLQQLEIPQMRMLDERERERIALEKARQAFDQTYQTAQLTGYAQPAAGQGLADQAQAAWEHLPPEQRTAEGAARIWKTLVPGLSDAEAAAMAPVGRDYYGATGQRLTNEAASQNLARITGGRLTGQTPTLPREQMQNQTMLQLLDLQSRLRGPGDWVQYMQTVQSVPQELRGVINQAAGRFQLPGAQPGAASVGGLVGDVAGGGMARGPGITVTDPMLAGGPQRAPGVFLNQGGGLVREALAGPGVVPGGGMGPATPQGQSAAGLFDVYRAAAGPASGPGGVEQMPTWRPGSGAEPLPAVPGGYRTAQPVGPAQPVGGALPLANQLPRSFASASPDVQDMILSPYEASGQSKRQVLYDFERSLPRYGGPTRGVVRR